MIRIIGIIVSVLMCSYVGIIKSKRYDMRVKELEICSLMCQKIITLLSYESTPTVHIISYLAKTQSLHKLTFLAECETLLNQGVEFPTAWKNSLEKEMQTMCLNKSDLSLIGQLSEVIGACDAQGQINTIKMYQAMFEQNCCEAAKAYQTKGKLCRSLGVLSGIAMSIMFI
ncbi:MAG: stage III sporulation protein AB [Oscillospiraceae bacterium]